MSVDRCVCHDMSFSELKRIAEERRLDFRGLATLTGCGENCGLCAPYLKEMLRTGATSQPPAQHGCSLGVSCPRKPKVG